MNNINKKDLSEMDIRTKYITPAIVAAGWDPITDLREEYKVTKHYMTLHLILLVQKFH